MDERSRIINQTRGNILCEEVVIADRPLPRLRGLMRRKCLPLGEGLLLVPAPSIHTAFMRFSIDVVFLDRDLRVLKMVRSLAPWRTAGARAHSTLELASGEVDRRGVQVGDVLRLVKAPRQKVWWRASSGFAAR
jgi:uncharacterized membrane protein (UPF0127 family)